MFGEHFYHETIKRAVSVFGTLFNNISVKRADGTALKVPLAYGPRQKWITRLQQVDTTTTRTAISLPRMGFELTSIEYDSTRKLTKRTQLKKSLASNPNNMQYQYSPAPYNLGFSLSVLVKNTDDGLQIIEQIMPYFTPDYTVTINTIPDMGDKRDVPITLTSVTQTDEYEGDFTTRQVLRYDLEFIMKNYIYGPVRDSDIIRTVKARTYIEKGSGEILGIRRNWNPEDTLTLKRQHFVHYVYVPGFGFYGLGLIHIIGGYAKAGTSLIRQLVDAGTLSNLPGGLKARGLRIKGDDTPIAPGEFKDVDVPSGSIRDNIMPLPYKEPSQTLLALLNQITQEGRRLGAISDMNISDMSANAPVGTTLALLERTLKPMAAVQARVHYAMKQEFRLLKRIMEEYAPAEYGYAPVRGAVTARQADYAMVDVIPVSDPNSSTMAQRVVQYQAVLQMSQSAPQIYNLPQLHRQMIEVLGVKNADKLVPTKDDAKPTDPVSENMDALVMNPMKAFIYQDHEAHIAAHTTFMQDPMIAQTIGQNPQAQPIMAALQAHIAEHLRFQYRKQIEEKLGAPLPAPNAELSEDMEVNLARVVAQAGAQLTQENQQKAAQQQAQQQAQDPLFQMKQAELQLKGQEEQRKAQKDQADIQLKAAELERKTNKDQADMMIEAEKLKLEEQELQIDAQKAGAKLAADRRKDNTKLDLDILKTMQGSKTDR